MRTRLEDGRKAPTDRAVDPSVQPAAPPSRSGFRRLVFDQRVRFVGAGAVNTTFAFLVFAALEATLGLIVNYMIVLLLAHVIGVLEAFLVYRLTVFRVKGNILRDLVRFESVYVLALGINAALLPLLVEFGHLPVILAQSVIVLFTSIVSFLGHKHFSFRRPRATW